jgi:hypothetical protein
MQEPLGRGQVLEFTKEPLAGSNLLNLLRLLAQNRCRIGWRYIPRFLYTLLLSGIMAPFRAAEHLGYRRAIEATEIRHDPVFIVGHWRSGTTYLHNVMSQDPGLAWFTTFQAYIPGLFLMWERLFKPVVAGSIPRKRPMDDVDMGADLPQEDQYAVGAYTPFSFYHGWCFPRRMQAYYDEVFIDEQTPAVQREWRRTYHRLIQKITLATGGRRLVLKNQDNTVHIPLLLDMYPDVRFIHIHRHPYEVYASMLKFLRIAVPLYCLQQPPAEAVLEHHMLDFYERFFTRYLRDRRDIPDGRLVEVAYADFVASPYEQTRRIYEELDLPGFDEASPRLEAYIDRQFEFTPDAYRLSQAEKERVYRRWRVVFDAYGYEP